MRLPSTPTELAKANTAKRQPGETVTSDLERTSRASAAAVGGVASPHFRGKGMWRARQSGRL